VDRSADRYVLFPVGFGHAYERVADVAARLGGRGCRRARGGFGRRLLRRRRLGRALVFVRADDIVVARPVVCPVVAVAEAVAVYFLNLYPYALATNDLTEWKALSQPECVFCNSVIDNVEKQVAAGHRSDGGLVSVESVSGVEVSEGFYNVRVAATQTPSNEYAPDGSRVDESLGSQAELKLVIPRIDSHWMVRRVQVDEVPAPLPSHA
jgi:hypothetical protein